MVADRICSENIKSVVICGVFSPVNAKQEEEFANGLKAALAVKRLPSQGM
jgi:N-methylhydantoinase A/oxoprolinase/acetone carboxylase beta subunit